MKLKLIVSLLVICLVFSLGSAQAQTVGNNTSQAGNISQTGNISQAGNISGNEGNLSTSENVSMLANKTINVSQASGGDVKWILPGPRKLDPTIFGTPEMPLGFEEEIGVPIENRSVIDNGTKFNATTEDTPFSDNFSRINGSFTMNLTDMTPVDVNESNDTAKATFNFTDPTGNIQYRVVLTNVTHVGQFHPVLGGVAIDAIAHGRTSIDTRLEPTSYVYGAVWGVGELYINGTLVSDNRVIHAMATERVRSPDQQGYRLLFDNELPHQGIQAHLLLPDMSMSGNGTMVKNPVPTNYTLPDGKEQPFIHVAFDNPKLQGLKILNYMNVTTGNQTGNMTGNMTGNQTGNMTGNQTGNMTGNMTGNQTGNMTGNMTGNQTGNMTGNMTGNQTGNMTGNMTGNQTGNMTGNQTGNMTGNQTGNMTGNMTGNQTGNMTGNMTNVSLMLESIQGIENDSGTDEMWFVYINGEPAEQNFGMNNVSEGDVLSFWYTTEDDGEAAIGDATYVANITIGGEAEEQQNENEDLTVLYDDAVNLTEGTFTFTPEGSDQQYELNNFTDIGALNETGLEFVASVMDNGTNDNTDDNMDNINEDMTEDDTDNNDMTDNTANDTADDTTEDDTNNNM